MMSLSLGEVQSTARKAVRGTGYPWDIADEAGRAARYLCANGMDGVRALAQCLSNKGPVFAPEVKGPDWSATGDICPLMGGASLSDFAQTLIATPIRLHGLAHPILLLPYVNDASRLIATPLAVAWDGTQVLVDGDGVELKAQDSLWSVRADTVHVTKGPPMTQPHPKQDRATPAIGDWDTLCTLAHKTYAPATDASRVSGAGAGLSDND